MVVVRAQWQEPAVLREYGSPESRRSAGTVPTEWTSQIGVVLNPSSLQDDFCVLHSLSLLAAQSIQVGEFLPVHGVFTWIRKQHYCTPLGSSFRTRGSHVPASNSAGWRFAPWSHALCPPECLPPQPDLSSVSLLLGALCLVLLWDHVLWRTVF